MENVVFGCLVHKFIYKSVICICWTSSERRLVSTGRVVCDTTREIPTMMTTANKSAVRIGEKNNGETHQRSTVTYTHVFLSEPIYSLCSHQTLFKPFLTSFSRSYKIKNEMRILMSNSIPQCYRICVKISINSRRKKL